jgi:hypothetical protein
MEREAPRPMNDYLILIIRELYMFGSRGDQMRAPTWVFSG